jgi:hypothetical protein
MEKLVAMVAATAQETTEASRHVIHLNNQFAEAIEHVV